MRIGVTSQNFRTITGHAGKTRKFLVFSVPDGKTIREEERLDLPKEMSMHEYRGDDHPIFDLDILITGGCGKGFRNRLNSHNVKVITTGETLPMKAVGLLIDGKPLKPAEEHNHDHHHESSNTSGIKVTNPTATKVTLDI